MKKILYFASMLVAMCSCGGHAESESQAVQADTLPIDSVFSVTGVWLRQVPGQDTVCGYALNEDGTAHSVNISDYDLCSWHQYNDSLMLVSAGADNKLDTIGWRVLDVNSDSIVLINREGRLVLGRQK